jgi:hypothetical protein
VVHDYNKSKECTFTSLKPEIMIQRIQTLFLLLTLIFSLLFLTGSLYRTTDPAGQEILVSFSGTSGASSPHGSIVEAAMMIFSLLLPAVAVLSVLLYKRRKLQTMLTGLAIASDIIVLIILGVNLFADSGNGFGVPVPGYRCILPVVNLLLLILALRSILKDEKLVRSYDRLR